MDQAVKEGAVYIDDIQVGKLKKLVTQEGEYGCVITMSGRRKADGLPVERTMGFVFGEDFFSRVDGIMQLAAQFESFRGRIEAITRNLSLGLGAVRRRRASPPNLRGTSASSARSALSRSSVRGAAMGPGGISGSVSVQGPVSRAGSGASISRLQPAKPMLMQTSRPRLRSIVTLSRSQ